MIRKLSELNPGQKGIVHSFSANHLYLKLMEMGCVPGEELLVEMVAPLGDPISIQVAGYRLSLRLNEAEHILVETATPAPTTSH
jgi:ferrous iron transport protein A